jgi:hypothetical protein
MVAAERDRLRQLAQGAGLTRLSDVQLAEFARSAVAMAALVRRLPKDLGGADEMALVFRLSPRAGDRS